MFKLYSGPVYAMDPIDHPFNTPQLRGSWPVSYRHVALQHFIHEVKGHNNYANQLKRNFQYLSFVTSLGG